MQTTARQPTNAHSQHDGATHALAIVSESVCLQARAVGNLHVDNELAAVVAEDENAHGAAARLKRLLQTVREVGLVSDGDAGLDVTALGHGDDWGERFVLVEG